MAKMRMPQGATEVSFGGEVFKANKKGIVEVPEEAVGALVSHGLVPAGEPVEDRDPPPPPPPPPPGDPQ